MGAGSADIVSTPPSNLHPEKNKTDVTQSTGVYGELSGFDPTDGTMPDEAIREWWNGVASSEQYPITQELGLGKSNRLAEILGQEARAFLDSVYDAWSNFCFPDLGLTT